MKYRLIKPWLKLHHLLGLVFLVLLISLAFSLTAPPALPTIETIIIEPGKNSSDISQILKEAGVLKSATIFRLIVKVRNLSGSLQAGDYVFEKPLSPWALASRLGEGVYSVNPLKVTVAEGLNMREIASLLEDQLPDFDIERFLSIAEANEGELMPDTYFISRFAKEDNIAA